MLLSKDITAAKTLGVLRQLIRPTDDFMGDGLQASHKDASCMLDIHWLPGWHGDGFNMAN